MSSKKKGLSFEEKKQRLLELFFEKKEFFQLKELEKLAHSEKGIVSQTVKEILQMLVDERLVETDKIGTLTCFWAFPSKALTTRKQTLTELEQQRKSTTKRKVEVQTALSTAQQQEKSDGRASLIVRVQALQAEKEKLETELKTFANSDPEEYSQLGEKNEAMKQSINQWTDNIVSIKKWCSAKFSIDEKNLDKQFGIPEDLNYVD